MLKTKFAPFTLGYYCILENGHVFFFPPLLYCHNLKRSKINTRSLFTKPVIICSKLTTEILEQGVKYVQS